MTHQLLERSAELAELTGWLSRVEAGQGDLIAITGVAGIGKSELLRATVDHGRRNGMRTLVARGSDMEAGFSFGVVRQLFEPVLDDARGAARKALLGGSARQALIALGGDLTESPDIDRSFAVIHGLYWLAVNLSRTAPLLLAIDDLHWSDEASIRWLLYLADRLQGLPVGVLLSSRTGDGGVAEELGPGWHTSECTYSFAGRTLRMIVRRQRTKAGEQLSFDDLDGWRFHAIVTNIPPCFGDAVSVEHHHRLRGGVPEEAIRQLKEDFGMNHAPLENFFGNWCWWLAAALAYNVAR